MRLYTFKEFTTKDFLLEFAARKDVIKNARNYSGIIEHLIKLLRYDDDMNYNKHLTDTRGWINQIQMETFNNKRLNVKEYTNIFQELVPTEQKLKQLEKTGTLKGYKDLKRIRNIKETSYNLEDIILWLGNELALGNATNDFIQYFNDNYKL